MSLILDALKKLEREKERASPASLVVGSVPWGETSRASRAGRSRSALPRWLVALACRRLAGGWRPRRRAAAARRAASPRRPGRRAAPPSPAGDRVAPTALRRRRRRRAPASARRPRLAGPAGSPTVPAPLAEPRRRRPPPARGEPPRGRRPTRPAPGRRLRLNAISERDGQPVALINDRLVFEGDSFDGVRVLRIGEAEVEVEVRGQRRVLRF